MWLPPNATAPTIPGYSLSEQRRETGKRGGIAIYTSNKLKIVRADGNEYAQTVQLQLPDSTKINIANVYLPPAMSLQKRKIAESTATEAVCAILA